MRFADSSVSISSAAWCRSRTPWMKKNDATTASASSFGIAPAALAARSRSAVVVCGSPRASVRMRAVSTNGRTP